MLHEQIMPLSRTAGKTHCGHGRARSGSQAGPQSYSTVYTVLTLTRESDGQKDILIFCWTTVEVVIKNTLLYFSR